MTANSREGSVFFDLYNEDTEGARPDRLFEVRPQERDQRRTVEQIVDNMLIVPSLDVLVPQMENQLVEVCRQLDFHIPELAIEVPKISSPCRHCRRRVRFAEQLAEQLVEAPTIVSFSSLQRIMEQNVDIPVPGGGGRLASRQCFPPRQSSRAADVEQIVEIPARGGLQDFLPDQGPTASSPSRLHDVADDEIQWVFRTFPRPRKSAKVTRQSSAELLGEVSSWTPAAHHGGFLVDEAPAAHLVDIVLESNMLRDEAGYVWMHMSANPSRWYLLNQRDSPRGVFCRRRATTCASVECWLSTCPSSCVSLRWFLGEFLHFFLAWFPLGNLEHSFVPPSYLACLGVA